MPPCHHLSITSLTSPHIAHSPLTTPASFLFLRLTWHTPVSGPSLQLSPVPKTLFPQVPPLSLTFRFLLLKVVLRTLVNSVISSPITWGNLPSLTGSTFLSHINYLISGRASTAQWQILALAVTHEEKESPGEPWWEHGQAAGTTLVVLTWGSTADAAKRKATFSYTILLL